MPYKSDIKIIEKNISDAYLKKSSYDTKSELARAIFFSKERKKFLKPMKKR